MPVNAYILIQTEVGRANDVVIASRAVPGVTDAQEVTGPYDVIVRCSGASLDELGGLVVGAIQKVPGITRTLTCPVVNV
jgi:DNA-binding Lrp family transcriptional regulator